MGDYDALRPAERQRLERFAAAFEDVDPLDYELFAGTTASEDDLAAARTAALEAIGSSTRRAAVERAAQAFTHAADVAIVKRFNPVFLYVGIARSPRPEDRVLLAQSLERAVVAVILWDELGDAEREVLLGPWARVAGRAIGGPAEPTQPT
jgi:hypothetical protein